MDTDKDLYLNDLQNRAFDLCLAIYRMVKYFPEREILVNQIKGSANELTANVLILGKINQNIISDTILQTERLIVFLRIAGTQGWLNPINFDFLISWYQKLIVELLTWENMVLKARLPVFPTRTAEQKRTDKLQSMESAAKQETKKPAAPTELNSRQKKILDFLNRSKEAKMSDLQGIFKNEVTERTLRNDLQGLVVQKLVRTEGEFKTRRYFIA